MDALSKMRHRLSDPACQISDPALLEDILILARPENTRRLIADLFNDHLTTFPLPSGQDPRVIEQGVMLFDSVRWLLVLRPAVGSSQSVQQTETTSVPTNPFIFVNCDERQAVLQAYGLEVDEGGPGLKLQHEICVQPGAACAFDGRSQVIDGSNGRAVTAIYLYSLEKPVEVRCEFSLSTGRPVFSSIGAPDLSSTKALLQWLAEIGSMEPDDQVVEGIAKFANHPFHVIRWAAVQAMSAIDFEAARPYIVAAQSDGHPDIARVAKRIVEREGL